MCRRSFWLALNTTFLALVFVITHLLVEKLLLMPTEQLKSLSDPETAAMYAEAITRVFGLDEAEQKTDSRVEPFRARPRPSGRER